MSGYSSDEETRTVTVWDNDGVPVEVRPYTAEENAYADMRAASKLQDANAFVLDTRVQAALITNSNIVTGATTYLAMADTADAAAVRVQVKALTQAMRKLAMQQSGIIRLLTKRLDDISDTD